MTAFRVETRNIAGAVTAIGSAGTFTTVIDRPVDGGGGGLGFNGGQLLHLAVAGCISNDVFREARTRNLAIDRVVVSVDGDFAGSPAVSTGITYTIEVEGDAPQQQIEELIRYVDEIAEIPNSLRRGTFVKLIAHTAIRSA